MGDMNTKHLDSKAREYATQLLDAAERDSSGVEVREALASLMPHIDVVIESRYQSWKGKLPQSLDDVVQDIRIKLLTSPPSQKKNSSDPLAQVLAWVSVTTFRHLVSLGRRQNVRGRSNVPVESVPSNNGSNMTHSGRPEEYLEISGTSSMGRNPAKIVETTDEAEKFARYLNKAAYKIAEFFVCSVENPFADDVELAAIMEISVNSIHKKRQRLREHLVRFREADSLKKRAL